MVYDNTTNSFWYFTGSVWNELVTGNSSVLTDADNDTKIQVEESADEDFIRFDVGGSERLVIKQSVNGSTLINLPNNHGNTFLGVDAGKSIIPTGHFDEGEKNNFIGYQAGYSNTIGFSNVFSGYQAGFSNTTGNGNSFSGYQAGFSNTTGGSNIFSGYSSRIF